MNQSILFNDDLTWHDAHQAVCFTALAGGALFHCIVTTTLVGRLSGKEADTPAGWVVLAEGCQFELEELAEALIEDDAADEDNIIRLG